MVLLRYRSYVCQTVYQSNRLSACLPPEMPDGAVEIDGVRPSICVFLPRLSVSASLTLTLSLSLRLYC